MSEAPNPTPPNAIDPADLPQPHVEWPLWTCSLESDTGSTSWTVGDVYKLSCKGDYIERLKEPVQFRFSHDSFNYTLHSLELLYANNTQAEFQVTAYKPGEFAPDWIEISSEGSGFRVEKLKWNVQSVISTEGQQQPPPQPFPLFPSYSLSYPLWLWIALAAVILLPSLILFGYFRRRLQVKRLVEKLTRSTSALGPYHQFNKELRILAKQRTYSPDGVPLQPLEFVSKMNLAFKTYLTQELKVPALDWTPHSVVKEIKRNNPRIYLELGRELRDALIELHRTERSARATPEDADQFKDIVMKLSDQIHRHTEERGRK